MARRKNKGIDIVIPYTRSPWWEEIRYSLRSIEKNVHGLGNVWIVGDKPKWAKNINYIKAEDIYKKNKGANIIRKILLACKNPRLSDTFIRMSDDQYFLKPINARDIKIYHTGNLWDLKLDLRSKRKWWFQRLRNARQYLQSIGMPAYNYETHVPMPVNKQKFLWMEKTPYVKTEFPANSIYFNVWESGERMPKNLMAKFYKENVPISVMKNKTFLGNDDLGLSYLLQNKLKNMFSSKSHFER
jgi:hypothetical protein